MFTFSDMSEEYKHVYQSDHIDVTKGEVMYFVSKINTNQIFLANFRCKSNIFR